jgi:translation elongation factor EF-G
MFCGSAFKNKGVQAALDAIIMNYGVSIFVDFVV